MILWATSTNQVDCDRHREWSTFIRGLLKKYRLRVFTAQNSINSFR
jgi:hypothetical protein